MTLAPHSVLYPSPWPCNIDISPPLPKDSVHFSVLDFGFHHMFDLASVTDSCRWDTAWAQNGLEWLNDALKFLPCQKRNTPWLTCYSRKKDKREAHRTELPPQANLWTEEHACRMPLRL